MTGQLRDVVERVPFLSLGLDLPPAPLYKDVMEKNIIPQARGEAQPRSLLTLQVKVFRDAWWLWRRIVCAQRQAEAK